LIVVGNFVTALDGVVSLNMPDHSSGGDISGFNQHDRVVMGLLRAAADAVIVGAGTLRAEPFHRWTAEYVYPQLAAAYRSLRTNLRKSKPPLNVIITSSGDINLDLPVFQSGEVPVLIVTTTRGLQRIHERDVPSSVQVMALPGDDRLSAQAILEMVNDIRRSDLVLVEGGPQLMGDFLAERRLHELFLTLAPQIAGRDGSTERPGFVAGKRFAPEQPLWGTLVSVKRASNHLFLRYSSKKYSDL
jgi:riboflavin biosynthesis pyrimidine reductase